MLRKWRPRAYKVTSILRSHVRDKNFYSSVTHRDIEKNANILNYSKK
jgi:hypothetical protein